MSPDTAPEHWETSAVLCVGCVHLPWREENLTHSVLYLIPWLSMSMPCHGDSSTAVPCTPVLYFATLKWSYGGTDRFFLAQQNQKTHPDIFTETQLPLPAEGSLPKKGSQDQTIKGKFSHMCLLVFPICVVDQLWWATMGFAYRKHRIALHYVHMVVIIEKLINWCQCRTETFWSFNYRLEGR